jgi:TRAP-type uncharacterized transport system substrate-binding protein
MGESVMNKNRALLITGLVLGSLVSQPLAAEPAARPKRQAPPMLSPVPAKADVNAWTVGLAGGLLEGTFIRYAADIAKVLDDGDNLRVIPQVTFGAVGNVTDLLHLKGIDIAITQSDVLDHFRRELNIPNIENRIHYISPLFRSEVHIYARGEFKTLKDLEGRKVAFNTRGSAANLTGQVVFQRLGIQVEPVFINNSIALEKMRSGEISAVVHVVGKPNDLFARYKPEPGFHFLPIEDQTNFTDYYVPARLEAADYPNLIPAGGAVETIAVSTVLATYNWPSQSDRYRRVARFIEAYFAKFTQLQQPPFQPKWQDIVVNGTVPGWTRYRVAEEVLAKADALEAAKDKAQLRSQFEAFLTENPVARSMRSGSRSENETLFNEFLRWNRPDRVREGAQAATVTNSSGLPSRR